MPHPAILVAVLLLAAGAAIYLELRRARRPLPSEPPVELSRELVQWAGGVYERFRAVAPKAGAVPLSPSLLADSKDEIRQAVKTLICYHVLHRDPESVEECKRTYLLLAAVQNAEDQETARPVESERAALAGEIEQYHKKIMALFPAYASEAS